MTEKWHIKKGGGVAKCDASIRDCPRGGEESHYPDEESAQKAFELTNAHRVTKSLSKTSKTPVAKDSSINEFADKVGENEITEIDGYKPSKAKYGVRSNPTHQDIETYQQDDGTLIIRNNDEKTYTTYEEYENDKAGKKAIVVNRNELTILKRNGQSAKSSSTPQKLRKGMRGWNKQNSMKAPLQIRSGQVIPNYTPEEKQKIKDHGYPETSALKPEPLVTDEFKREPIHSSSDNPQSVLPTGDRVNPHEAPEKNQFIDAWNGMGTSYEGNNHIIVVESNGSHRLIGTAGSPLTGDHVGDTFTMQHDQTHANMGNARVVGLFEPWPGGRAEGEIPNKSMPLGTYK